MLMFAVKEAGTSIILTQVQVGMSYLQIKQQKSNYLTISLLPLSNCICILGFPLEEWYVFL